MKHAISLISFVILLSLGVSAQISVAPAVGGYIVHRTERHDGEQRKVGQMTTPSFRIGAIGSVVLSNKLALQTGIYFAYNTFKFDNVGPYSNTKANVNALDVPIQVVYSFHQMSSGHFFVGLGPWVAVNLGGKTGIYNGGTNVIREKIHFGNGDNDGHRRVDLGLSASVGYELRKGLSARIHFQKGIKNMYPEKIDTYRLTSYSYGLTFAYRLPLSK